MFVLKTLIKNSCLFITGLLVFLVTGIITQVKAQINVGAKVPKKAEIFFDGTRRMLDEKLTYWQGPGFAAALPIKWKIVNDPLKSISHNNTVINSNDPASAGGRYGAADIVTKKGFRDFRLHIEFLIEKKRRKQWCLSAEPLRNSNT